jgi:hypothetical protein
VKRKKDPHFTVWRSFEEEEDLKFILPNPIPGAVGMKQN